ncbi:hypothetical protein T01_8609 [Trichinella spiralis]|uniref:Uncharacterized protein n=1 Tax=Trichinella spiralis TaxID=6334 RepID=A0A0V1AYA7_TRISP|nr:hypothetical protein T01_8609 [Trichinella spiralis]
MIISPLHSIADKRKQLFTHLRLYSNASNMVIMIINTQVPTKGNNLVEYLKIVQRHQFLIFLMYMFCFEFRKIDTSKQMSRSVCWFYKAELLHFD